MRMQNSEIGIIIRNIKNDSTSDSKLYDSLYDLLNNYMGISTPLDCISIHIDKDKQRYAQVYAKSDTDVKTALDKLKDRTSRNRIRFQFLSIADEGVNIVASAILPNKYYRLGQQLRTETREREFKTGGGGYIRQNSRNDISKYMCGFLNSHVKGTLYIGVTEEDGKGVVCGVPIEMSEDMVRRAYVDEAAKDIKPTVRPKLYSVEFVPIEHNGTIQAGCFVIEINVKKMKEKTKKLYVAKSGEVYVRRDGSTHKLTGGDVQDWLDQMNTSKACSIS